MNKFICRIWFFLPLISTAFIMTYLYATFHYVLRVRFLYTSFFIDFIFFVYWFFFANLIGAPNRQAPEINRLFIYLELKGSLDIYYKREKGEFSFCVDEKKYVFDYSGWIIKKRFFIDLIKAYAICNAVNKNKIKKTELDLTALYPKHCSINLIDVDTNEQIKILENGRLIRPGLFLRMKFNTYFYRLNGYIRFNISDFFNTIGSGIKYK